MTAELEKKLSAAATLSELEDIYRPYKQKRRTRAMIAKEKGVQPLADLIFAQRRGDDPLALAQAYVSEEKGVPDAETARSAGAGYPRRADQRRCGDPREVCARSTAARACCVPSPPKRAKAFTRSMRITANAVLRAAGHRILAINRGEREEWLKVAVECDDEQAIADHLPRGDPAGQRLLRRGARGGEGRVGQAHQPVA